MPLDPQQRERLRQDITQRFSKDLLAFLDRCELNIDRLDYLNTRDLAGFFGLSALHRDRLGLRSDELLVLLLSARDQYQWFHEEVRQRIRAHDRLDRAAVLIVSNDPNIVSKCSDARPDPETGYRTSLVPLPLAGIRGKGFQDLERAFHDHAFRTDHFDSRVPVTGDNIFGRQQLINQLESDLMRHGRPVGLFGMRRVGKSSVLGQLLAQLRASTSPRIAVAVADLQKDSYNVTASRIAASLCRELARIAESLGSRYRDTGQGPSFDRVAGLTRHIVKKGLRVVLALDEIEWLVPTAANEQVRGPEFHSVLGALRALKHEMGDDIGLICCGINQRFTEIPTVLDYPNPVLDFFTCRYVAGLDRMDFDDMLRTLGHRMGISFAPNFLYEAFQKFGGHPYLTRQFCSALSEECSRPALFDESLFQTRYGVFLSEKRSLITEVMTYFRHFYPDEYRVLEAVAHNRNAPVSDSAAQHLRSYGMVEAKAGSLRIRVDAVTQWFVHEKREQLARVASILPERFDLVRELGSGATARVIHVRDRVLSEDRALKLYDPSVSSVAVRAEFSILREVRSPYVVNAYDVFQTSDKSMCLIMEYVPGRSLEQVLQERSPVATSDLAELADQLFKALKSIHPDLARIEQLKSLPDLDEDNMHEYIKLRDSGVLHRDIKPSNIVVSNEPTWECKLLDLGLARPASAVGLTRVGTEAYLPPDWGAVQWNAGFDLYALAVILFRAATGHLPSRDNDGLIGKSEGGPVLDPNLWSFFQAALGAASANRFEHVDEMRSAFRTACPAASQGGFTVPPSAPSL